MSFNQKCQYWHCFKNFFLIFINYAIVVRSKLFKRFFPVRQLLYRKDLMKTAFAHRRFFHADNTAENDQNEQSHTEAPLLEEKRSGEQTSETTCFLFLTISSRLSPPVSQSLQSFSFFPLFRLPDPFVMFLLLLYSSRLILFDNHLYLFSTFVLYIWSLYFFISYFYLDNFFPFFSQFKKNRFFFLFSIIFFFII